MFGQHYVRTGIFNMEDGRLYSQLQTIREKGDYNCVYQTSEEEVLPMITPATNLIERIIKYIG